MICLQFIVISEQLFILLSHFSLFEYKSYSYVEWGVLHKNFPWWCLALSFGDNKVLG